VKIASGTRLVALLAMALLPLAAAACPASDMGGNGGTGGVSGCDAPNMVFKTTCTGSNCHGPGPFPPSFEVADPSSMLVGQPALTSTSSCTGMPLVNAADPAASVLLTRLKGATCGEQMPSNFDMPDALRVPITQQQLDCVTSWVMAKKR
jgi:hypothetical protein